ncbi:MAG TPA: response regulator transcription factor [Mesotoga sp.]|jgi:DNA-binding response OmpR family regulator|nr:response regulator transcription factor [Mesotoga sp.]MDD4039514.1 response regulator transcription factor [Mesotoga sp.]MDD4479790.1 response regulator transcription factor [Mesotoga sp.]HOI62942.1 response regulator transcription factor [Mesotoga sp.]HPM94549.1 response regulator transcription factor [Mesotoga sp.]
MKGNVVVVEDDVHIGKLLQMELSHEGYSVEVITEGETALKRLEKKLPDLLILDVMLPGANGFRVLNKVREYISTDLPIIMLTARGDVEDRVRGLKGGADDYIPKPFVIEELLARMEAIFRRRGILDRVSFHEISIDNNTKEVTVGGEPVQLSKTEFELLFALLTNAGIVMSKERLLEKVWGSEEWGNPNVVEVYINYLRKKLGQSGERIKTVRGSGYVVR